MVNTLLLRYVDDQRPVRAGKPRSSIASCGAAQLSAMVQNDAVHGERIMITADTVSSDEITIEAPIQLVWDVLVNFSDYGSWNSFCPQCEAALEIGSPIKMQVDLGFGLQEQVEH